MATGTFFFFLDILSLLVASCTVLFEELGKEAVIDEVLNLAGHITDLTDDNVSLDYDNHAQMSNIVEASICVILIQRIILE